MNKEEPAMVHKKIATCLQFFARAGSIKTTKTLKMVRGLTQLAARRSYDSSAAMTK